MTGKWTAHFSIYTHAPNLHILPSAESGAGWIWADVTQSDWRQEEKEEEKRVLHHLDAWLGKGTLSCYCYKTGFWGVEAWWCGCTVDGHGSGKTAAFMQILTCDLKKLWWEWWIMVDKKPLSSSSLVYFFRGVCSLATLLFWADQCIWLIATWFTFVPTVVSSCHLFLVSLWKRLSFLPNL